MRDLSKLENSSSAMPPKFMGRDSDSLMRWSLAKVRKRSQTPMAREYPILTLRQVVSLTRHDTFSSPPRESRLLPRPRKRLPLTCSRIRRDDFEVVFERVGRVRLDKIDPIVNLSARLREVAAVEPANDRATAECVSE